MAVGYYYLIAESDVSILVLLSIRRSNKILTKTRPTRIQADFIVVEPGRILPGGQLLVSDNRIVEVVEDSQIEPDLHLNGQTLLPGLINSHTHLEFSDLTEPFQAAGSFPEWISTVVQHRRRQAQSLSSDQLEQHRRATLLRGMIECAQSGTSVLVDIATEPWQLLEAVELIRKLDSNQATLSCEDLKETGRDLAELILPAVIALSEMIGLDEARFSHTSQWAQSLIESFGKETLRDRVLSVGYSPHAPYSLIHPHALDQFKLLDRSLPVAMHVAESLEELEWAEHGRGSFRDVYQRIGLPTDSPRMQIDQAIDLLAEFERPLLIHGNYLNEQQLDRIARGHISQGRIAIVYCPRTHQHFRHRPYPLDMILERGIPILLGTDSRASNPDLSVWEECRTASRLHPNWMPEQILAAVTTLPAKHLGIQCDFGSLAIGRRLPINVVSTPFGANQETLLRQLFSADHPVPKPLCVASR